MTKIISSSRISTLDSVLNTLKTFWGWLIPRNVRWMEVRTEAIAEQRVYKKEKGWDREKWRDWDIARERVVFNDGMVTIETLVGDLVITLEENPFPGEQRTVLNVAVELFPEAKAMLQPNVFISGERLWVKIFNEGGVNYRERVCFPVKVTEIDIVETEELLWKMVREDGTIVAADVPAVLNLGANSKSYRVVKLKLQERDWRWGQQREKGKMTKVVFAPK